MKLPKFLRRLLGYTYILNIKSAEVHCEYTITPMCSINKMKESNKKYITKRQYNNLKYTYINKRIINGCIHCNQATNKE